MVESCTTCVYGGRPTYDYPCSSCVKTIYPDDIARSKYERKQPQMTNADRIRSMSDEELVEVLRPIYDNEICINPTCLCEKCYFDRFCSHYGKKLDVNEWLQQPWEVE